MEDHGAITKVFIYEIFALLQRLTLSLKHSVHLVNFELTYYFSWITPSNRYHLKVEASKPNFEIGSSAALPFANKISLGII